MITPTPGSRVVMRYRRPDGSTPPLTDVIGRFDRAGDAVSVTAESGEVVSVPTDRVVAIKALAPRPVRTSEIRGLESAAADAWPGLEHEELGGWLLRASSDGDGRGVTRRGNCAVPLRPGATEADLSAIVDWYAARGLPPRIALPDRLFRAPAGWTVSDDVVVLTAPTTPSAPLLDGRTRVVRRGPVRDHRSGATRESDDAWFDHHPRLRGAPDLLTATRDGTAILLTAHEAAAVARAAVTTAPDGTRWVGISCVATHPASRRRGHALTVCADAMAWGAEQGASRAYVQVESDNTAASALYERLGFTEHHRYRYAHQDAVGGGGRAVGVTG